MKAIQQFFQTYVLSVCVFDPLDRAIPNEHSDQATKRDDIVQKIQDMPFIPGNYLNIPLSNTQIRNIEKMFEYEKEECDHVIEELMIKI